MGEIILYHQADGLHISSQDLLSIYSGKSREDALKALKGRDSNQVVYQTGVRTTVAEVKFAIEASLILFPDNK